MWVFIAVLLMLIAAFCCFGIKKTITVIYCVLKGAVFKTIEFFLRLLIAFARVNSHLLLSFVIVILLSNLFMPERTLGFVLLVLDIIFGWLILMLTIRNYGDEDDRDLIRMHLARWEHKLCFNRKDLSIYPNDWHWLE